MVTNQLEDFYCDEVLSGNTLVETVLDTENVLAFYHTRPFYEEHIVVIPKKHILSIITIQQHEMDIMMEVFGVIKEVATKMNKKYGACSVSTNVGEYQGNKHMHWHVHHGNRIRNL